MKSRVVIKKYENRRLYDTANSRYVNLDEVAQMIREDIDVQVVDAATGEDLTRLVLTQIIVEDAKSQHSSFPVDMLRQMVMSSGRASQEGFLRYMKTMFGMYQNAYQTFTPAASPFDFMKAADSGQTPPVPNAPPDPSDPPPAPAESAPPAPREVEDLRRRLEELEKLISGTPASPSRKRPRAPRRPK